MDNKEHFFLSVIERIFSNWTGLRMAVEHGMGTIASAREFVPFTLELMCMNGASLNTSDVAFALEGYMDDYFNTELEDDSPIQVAEELIRFHKYCTEGNEAVAIAEFEKLLPLQPWITKNEPQSSHLVQKTAHDDSDTDEDSQNMEGIDDEWTEVKSRRRK